MAHRLCSQPNQVQCPAGGQAYYLIKTTSSSKNILLGPLEHSQSHCDAVIEIVAAAIRLHREPLALCLIKP
jgi:hypothetical protein